MQKINWFIKKSENFHLIFKIHFPNVKTFWIFIILKQNDNISKFDEVLSDS